MKKRFIEEILEQSNALVRCAENYPVSKVQLNGLADDLSASRYRQIILTGMGSSLHACYPLWLSLNASAVIPTLLWDASELIHHAPTAIDNKTLLIAVSQSGETVEIKRLAELSQRPGLVIGITNDINSTLARWSDRAIDIMAGDEATVSTKTYTATLAANHLLGTQLTGGDVNAARDEVLDSVADVQHFLDSWQLRVETMQELLGQRDHLTFLGRGASMAGVLTGSLITMESSKVVSLGLSSAQFRHGPLELIDSNFMAVIFAGTPSFQQLHERLANEIVELGGRCLVITPDPLGNRRVGSMELSIPRSSPALLPIFEILPVQLLTIALAQAKGLSPASFRHAAKITSKE